MMKGNFFSGKKDNNIVKEQSNDLYDMLFEELSDEKKTIKDVERAIKKQINSYFGGRKYVEPNKYFAKMIEKAQKTIIKQRKNMEKQLRINGNAEELLKAAQQKLKDGIAFADNQEREYKKILDERSAKSSDAFANFYRDKINRSDSANNFKEFATIQREIDKYLNTGNATPAGMKAMLMMMTMPRNLQQLALKYVDSRLKEIQQYKNKENKMQQIISTLKDEFLKIEDNKQKKIVFANSEKDALIRPEQFFKKLVDGKTTIENYFNTIQKYGKKIDKEQFFKKGIEFLQNERNQEQQKVMTQLKISETQLAKMSFANSYCKYKLAGYELPEDIEDKYGKNIASFLKVSVAANKKTLNKVINDNEQSMEDVKKQIDEIFENNDKICAAMVNKDLEKNVEYINLIVGRAIQKYDNAISNLTQELMKCSSKKNVKSGNAKLYKKQEKLSFNESNNLINSISTNNINYIGK